MNNPSVQLELESAYQRVRLLLKRYGGPFHMMMEALTWLRYRSVLEEAKQTFWSEGDGDDSMKDWVLVEFQVESDHGAGLDSANALLSALRSTGEAYDPYYDTPIKDRPDCKKPAGWVKPDAFGGE